MGTSTAELNLYKPDDTELVDVETHLNDNMDKIDAFAADLNPLLTPPRCKVHQSNGNHTELANADWTTITFPSGTTVFDVGNIHDSGANTDRLTIPEDGTYRVAGKVSVVQNDTGSRGTRWTKNTTPVPGTEVMLAAAPDAPSGIPAVTTLIDCVAGDIIRLQGYQSSGSPKNTYTAAGDTHVMTFMEIEKVVQA